jgi:hypothetical protein
MDTIKTFTDSCEDHNIDPQHLLQRFIDSASPEGFLFGAAHCLEGLAGRVLSDLLRRADHDYPLTAYQRHYGIRHLRKLLRIYHTVPLKNDWTVYYCVLNQMWYHEWGLESSDHLLMLREGMHVSLNLSYLVTCDLLRYNVERPLYFFIEQLSEALESSKCCNNSFSFFIHYASSV